MNLAWKRKKDYQFNSNTLRDFFFSNRNTFQNMPFKCKDNFRLYVTFKKSFYYVISMVRSNFLQLFMLYQTGFCAGTNTEHKISWSYRSWSHCCKLVRVHICKSHSFRLADKFVIKGVLSVIVPDPDICLPNK